MEWFSEINENESRRTTRARMTRVIKKKIFSLLPSDEWLFMKLKTMSSTYFLKCS
jgi:hypothetical protein